MILNKIKEKGEEMEPLVGHDRLQYLIDIANTVPPLDKKDKIEENKIRGCVSNLWVTGEERQDGTMYYKHDADAFITKGTAKIIVDLVNGEQKKEIAELTLESFEKAVIACERVDYAVMCYPLHPAHSDIALRERTPVPIK